MVHNNKALKRAQFEMRIAQMVSYLEDHDWLQFPSADEPERKLPYLTDKFEDWFFMAAMTACLIIEMVGIAKICRLLHYFI